MTSYHLLTSLERLGATTVEIREKVNPSGRLDGVARRHPTNRDLVRCFIGNEDGSDDREFTLEEFNERFEITAAIFEPA